VEYDGPVERRWKYYCIGRKHKLVEMIGDEIASRSCVVSRVLIVVGRG